MDEAREIEQLKGNADNLAKCLHALLERIETLEKRDTPKTERAADDESEKQEQVAISDDITTDPVTGLRKRTIVTERVLTTKTFHSLALETPGTMQPICNGRLLSPMYQSRAVQVDARQLDQLELECLSGQLVVTGVHPSANHDIHPGDTITDVDGKPVSTKADLLKLGGRLTLTLVPAAIHNAPSLFYRVHSSYCSESDPSGCKWLPISVNKGDVVQVMSSDPQWMQARKVNDLSRVGYLPASLELEKVSMLCPFGRRVLVLLGAVGVGRRTLKSLLLRAAPQHFATVVPLTSRPIRNSEQEGRDYSFQRKEDLLQRVREGDMVEWGELDGHIYGTSAESVRTIVRSGRVCVLDCAPQALSYLYNGEFMPFVVHIVPPPLEEFLQLEQLRHQRRPVDQLSKVCALSDEIANGSHSNQIHLTLINRNMDVTFKRLTDALENLRSDTQWVPDSWMC